MHTAITDTKHQPVMITTIQALVVIIVTGMILMLFRVFPNLDLAISQLAFTPMPCSENSSQEICGFYYLQRYSVLVSARQVSFKIPYFLMTFVAGYYVYLVIIKSCTTAIELRNISLIILTMLLATVGLVNLLLKEHWGRPRPYQVEGLGGEHPFVLPGTISDYCTSNCSFVSGEASSAAWLFTFLVIVPRNWRIATGLALSAYLIFFSGLRVAFGKHFLSDVVLSILFTVCVFFILRASFSTRFFQSMFIKFAIWSNQFAFK